jgi:hypothetical protein
MDSQHVKMLSNIYTVLYGIILLHLYASFLATKSINILMHLPNTSTSLLYNDIAIKVPALLQSLLTFTLILIPLIIIEILIVLYYKKRYQLLAEALLFFLFTGDLIILIELTFLSILFIKIIQFFIDFKKKAGTTMAFAQHQNTIQLHESLKFYYNDLPTALICFGLVFISLAIETLLYSFIPLIAVLLYILLLFITMLTCRRFDIKKSILLCIPPYGIIIAIRDVTY